MPRVTQWVGGQSRAFLKQALVDSKLKLSFLFHVINRSRAQLHAYRVGKPLHFLPSLQRAVPTDLFSANLANRGHLGSAKLSSSFDRLRRSSRPDLGAAGWARLEENLGTAESTPFMYFRGSGDELGKIIQGPCQRWLWPQMPSRVSRVCGGEKV